MLKCCNGEMVKWCNGEMVKLVTLNDSSLSNINLARTQTLVSKVRSDCIITTFCCPLNIYLGGLCKLVAVVTVLFPVVLSAGVCIILS